MLNSYLYVKRRMAKASEISYLKVYYEPNIKMLTKLQKYVFNFTQYLKIDVYHRHLDA